MNLSRLVVSVATGMALAGLAPSRAAAQDPTTAGALWTTAEAHAQLRSDIRLLVLGQSKSGTDYFYQQWNAGAGLDYQLKRFARRQSMEFDPDRQRQLTVGAGYEYLRTTESGTPSSENRIIAGLTARVQLPSGLLLSDRNRFEFRWVDGNYSSRYRNRASLNRPTQLNGIRFTPYVSAEFFYDWAKNSWNQERYAVGIEWPYESLFKLSTYYLRQNCPTCSPAHLNVLGLTLQYFLPGPS